MVGLMVTVLWVIWTAVHVPAAILCCLLQVRLDVLPSDESEAEKTELYPESIQATAPDFVGIISSGASEDGGGDDAEDGGDGGMFTHTALYADEEDGGSGDEADDYDLLIAKEEGLSGSESASDGEGMRAAMSAMLKIHQPLKEPQLSLLSVPALHMGVSTGDLCQVSLVDSPQLCSNCMGTPAELEEPPEEGTTYDAPTQVVHALKAVAVPFVLDSQAPPQCNAEDSIQDAALTPASRPSKRARDTYTPGQV